MRPVRALRAFQAAWAREPSWGLTGLTSETSMMSGSWVVTGTVWMSADTSAGSPASWATSDSSAARLPGSGIRTVMIGMPFTDETIWAFSLVSSAWSCGSVAPDASSSSS